MRTSQETQGLCFCLTDGTDSVFLRGRAKWYSGQWNAVLCYTLVQFSPARRGAELLGPEADGAHSWC